MKKITRVIALIAGLLSCTALHAQTEHRIDGETGIESWEVRTGGIYLSLTQILPDQVRGFFLARGFDEQSVEHIARGCVFQTVLRNESNIPIRFDLREWRARTAEGDKMLKLNEQWQRDWERFDVPASARTAFRWALFPMVQVYARGDWNMGMSMYPLAHNALFDLKFVWHSDGQRHEGVLQAARCAGEIAHAKK